MIVSMNQIMPHLSDFIPISLNIAILERLAKIVCSLTNN